MVSGSLVLHGNILRRRIRILTCVRIVYRAGERSRPRRIRTGREGLSEADAATAWAEGQSLSLDEAVAYAMDPKAVPAAFAHG